MSPQRSNREALIEGTIRCLESLPPEQVTARAIAAESGANLASIGYHFGSKDDLVAAALAEGLRRWLAEVADGLSVVPAGPSASRLRHAAELVDRTRQRHLGVARWFLVALARALHDEPLRRLLADSFRAARNDVVRMLDLGTGETADDAATVLLATFDGLLIRALLHPEFIVDADRLAAAAQLLTTTSVDTA